MLDRLAEMGMRRPKRVLWAALAMLVVAGVIGGGAANVLQSHNDFENPGGEAAAARIQLERATGAEASPGVIALVAARPGSAEALSVQRQVARDPGVASVVSYANTHDARLVAKDGQSTVIAASLQAGAVAGTVVDRLEQRFEDDKQVLLGGSDVAIRQIDDQVEKDLAFAEFVIFPLMALLTWLVFRGVAALLPLFIGLLTVLGASAVLVAINTGVDVSIFALNLVFGLGLGLAIDYSLFMVSRFREELGRGATVPNAVRTTMRTAGRTVVYSALTVAAAGVALMVFPLGFLQSMGLGGAVVALCAAAATLVVLPALFLLMGTRLGRFSPIPVRQGRWYALAHRVMRRPGLVVIATIAVLLVLALPSLRAQWTGVDASILPTSQSARVVDERVAHDFPQLDSAPMVLAISAPRDAAPDVARYRAAVSRVAGIDDAGQAHFIGTNTWRLTASASGSPIGTTEQETLSALRALPAPFPVVVGGDAAQYHDQQRAIAVSLPLAMIILFATTLMILWLMTGSVVLPIKALIMNVLTVGVATGVLVWIFQDGRLTGLLSYTPQNGIETADFIVLVAIAFALSTDYGVFLLTRIKEARDMGIGDREAVAVGLQRSGRIVTAAAFLLAVAIGSFVTAQIIFLKEIGLGAAVAVLVDAFVIRALLVPSLMAVLGSINWWQPAPLRLLHERLRHHGEALPAREPA
jgi:uncharacterized membrane protein YdfJ with MMPL/SSD domain